MIDQIINNGNIDINNIDLNYDSIIYLFQDIAL